MPAKEERKPIQEFQERRKGPVSRKTAVIASHWPTAQSPWQAAIIRHYWNGRSETVTDHPLMPPKNGRSAAAGVFAATGR